MIKNYFTKLHGAITEVHRGFSEFYNIIIMKEMET